MKTKNVLIVLLVISFVFPGYLFAEEAANNTETQKPINYHLVGWFNTFIPGGGEFLNGNYGYGALQFVLETGTFAAGFLMSRRSPMTLDGVPEALPAPYNFKRVHKSSYLQYLDKSSSKVIKAMNANILQEFGIKYHMVNVFNAYRNASGEENDWIDKTSTADLFLAPFKGDVMSDPWVYVPIAVTAAATIADYFIIRNNIKPVSPVNAGANAYYAFNYGAVYPVGSGAPEEMFYRGFLQNEAYSVVHSPFFSIPISTLAFAYSHSSDERLPAGVSGLYMGYLTHRKHGKLSPAIAYHFWADVITGLMTIALYVKAQNMQVKPSSTNSQPLTFSFMFNI